MQLRGLKKACLLIGVNAAVLAVLLEGGAILAYWLFVHNAEDDSSPSERLLSGPGDAAEQGSPDASASEFAPSSVLHPYIGYVKLPQADSASAKDSALTISRFGFTGDHSDLKRREDEVIVALSGGSVAASFYKHGVEDLRRQLESSPAFAGKKIRFVSFALAGFKQPQALMTLNYFLVLGAEFDLWINLDGFNEIVLPMAENLPAQVALEYPRMWNMYARKIPDRTVLLKLSEVEAAKRERAALREFFARPVLSRSSFSLLLWDLLDRSKKNAISELTQELSELVFDSTPSPQTSGPAFDRAPGSEEDNLREAARLWRVSSLQMARLCAANGIAYYHFLQPNQHYEGSKLLSEEESAIAISDVGYAPYARKGYPALVEEGAKLVESGVPFYDLTQIFANEPRTLYIDPCCHFNELGNELLAEAIAEAIAGSRKESSALQDVNSTQ